MALAAGRMAVALVLALLTIFLVPRGQAEAQGVISIARGAGDSEVSVAIDQAIVVESAVPFADVSIAQPEVADVEVISERALYVYGRGRGRTSLTLIGADGRLIANVRVIVEAEVTELKRRLAQLLPGEAIEVHTLDGNVVLSGTVSGAQQVDQAMSLARASAGEDVTNLLSVGGKQQVALKVRIAEVNRSAAKDLGLGIGVSHGGNTPARGATGRVNVPADQSNGIFEVQDRTGYGALDAIISVSQSTLVNLSIDALESKGFARTLAEPNLVALSGGEADFLAGGEVPIPVIGEEGRIDVDYRPVGVSLAFRPTVLRDGQINIAVTTEVSNVDPALGTSVAGRQIFGFSVRRATTTVELGDGQSFAIAGLYQDNFSSNVDQVPVLGDIPILGTLFRSSGFQRNETELVVLVTADLAGPVRDARVLADPTQRLGLPTEAELFLFGQVTGSGAPPPPFDGPFGYAMP